MDTIIAAAVTALVCLAVCVTAHFVRKRREEKKIRELIDYLTRVQDHSELPQMKEMSEGQIGILQSEIYKVVTILKEEYSSEHRQKKYMSDMMSDISHQFKTPLTAVSLMTELLMAPDVTEEQRYDYAAKIDTQISKMTWLIRNLLTLSQLEAGVLEMKCADIPLASVTEDIARSLEVMADAAEVELSFAVPEGLSVHADGHWLREALTNIIKNCIEHTAEGGFVRVSARRDNLAAYICIEDNGSGIDKEHLPHIFERFYKAGNASNESVGIGLAMAKQILRNHGGDIEAESEKGVGTKFRIRLP
ncbi:MAG: HAMP domain-containing histidine kinase [Lachnospiraceae bacterium]|nr:HAMP domain-containing histidine kinase [Lachnospiraceae bacterium]